MIEIRQPQIQREKAVQAMQTFLETLGLDLKVLQMEKTPNRVTDAFINFFSGLWKNPDDEWAQPIQTEVDGLVAIRNIRFQSMCEHHLLPFFGTVHIAYYPHKGKVAGFGRFVSAVETLTKRPQLQERLTQELSLSLCRGLQPEGVLVVVEATHLCMTMMHGLAGDTNIITTATAGIIQSGSDMYHQAWNLLMEGTSDDGR